MAETIFISIYKSTYLPGEQQAHQLWNSCTNFSALTVLLTNNKRKEKNDFKIYEIQKNAERERDMKI